MPSPTEEVRAVWTSDQGSMAQQTAVTRWPKIVEGTVDDIDETAASSDKEKRAERAAMRIALQEIMHEIERNEPLKPLREDGVPGIGDFNKQLNGIGSCSWLDCPWLFAECYLYRRIQTIFNASKNWQGYDVFKRRKDSTFVTSRAAVEELASREEAQRLLFIEMTEIALWGNATDLSLLSHLSMEDLQDLQGQDAIQKNQKNIVDNDTDAVWAYLQCTPSPVDRHVDIVLDNAGFELFTDLIYAAYLLDSQIATSVQLHTKQFPWFVSDVVLTDVDSLFEHLGSAKCFPDREYLDRLVPRLRKFFECGAISTTSEPFWTTPYSFHEMPNRAPALFDQLQSSYLVIFKGDLNYRKLTKDGLWPYTTSFRETLGPLGKSRMKILALRTNKSDTCVGVESQVKVDALNAEAPGGAWVRNGRYAVISFHEGHC
ncbi:hypothetical protein Asppvi_009323 [Aspergillus pseudoviridinutans]|uniref:Sugar phosphate phosphatase n=1 Tax=Aspergillus pseudoviridinutans TaxID=1517512 RepID=A0A9P3EW34_9EURO|nr:uncharacterized protein Asppvi_009323 [Aspergillus pseudoviridinutans]GIJ90369.1 hypothetical protein Asppvi_009323 [Aspergillus pseudoviridinutans]